MERSEIVHLQNKHDDVCIICNTSFLLVKMTVKTMEGSEQVGNFLYLSLTLNYKSVSTLGFLKTWQGELYRLSCKFGDVCA